MPAVRYTDKVQAPAFTVERADGSLRDLGFDTPVGTARLLNRIDRWRILNANDCFGQLGNANALSTNQLRAFPLLVEGDVRLNQAGVYVTGGAKNGDRLRLGLYRAGADGQPGALVWQAPEFTSETNNAELVATITGGLLLTPDIYYFALLANSGLTLRGVPASMQRMVNFYANISVTTQVTRLELALPYGPLPATFPGGYIQANGAGFTPAALFARTSNS